MSNVLSSVLVIALFLMFLGLWTQGYFNVITRVKNVLVRIGFVPVIKMIFGR